MTVACIVNASTARLQEAMLGKATCAAVSVVLTTGVQMPDMNRLSAHTAPHTLKSALAQRDFGSCIPLFLELMRVMKSSSWCLCCVQ